MDSFNCQLCTRYTFYAEHVQILKDGSSTQRKDWFVDGWTLLKGCGGKSLCVYSQLSNLAIALQVATEGLSWINDNCHRCCASYTLSIHTRTLLFVNHKIIYRAILLTLNHVDLFRKHPMTYTSVRPKAQPATMHRNSSITACIVFPGKTKTPL